MRATTCKRTDCLNHFVRRDRDGDTLGTYCLALIEHPPATCDRYTPPSWIPHDTNIIRRRKK